MKYTAYIIVLLFFAACANVDTAKTSTSVSDTSSYIGVDIPDFKNDKIDSLLSLYEADRALFYKAQEMNDMQIYYKSKIGRTDSYNVTGFYDDVTRILNMEKDTAESRKFTEYISQSSEKSRAFMSRIKKNKK